MSDELTKSSTSPPDPPPTSLITPRPSRAARSLPWLIPLAALAIAALLIAQSLAARGPRLSLSFDDGHGLKANDPVMHRGVQVGRIRTISLAAATHKVRIDIELAPDAAFLNRFWIVRPELSLSRVTGLETIVGPRYIAADSVASSQPATLENPPPDSTTDGLTLLIRAPRGAPPPRGPVSFREMHVGEVTAVTLAPDARSIEISVRIQPQHAHLVRPSTRFWNVSGIGLDLGLIGGLKLKAESLQTILTGGLAFATPDKPAPAAPVESGHEFALSEYDEDALKWSPDLSKP